MSTAQATTNRKRVLVITEHKILGKAIETGLRHLVDIDQYGPDQRTDPTVSLIEHYGMPDLIILTQLSRGSDPARARDLAAALNGHDNVAVLVICEQPMFATLRGDLIHYLGFPFTLADLQTKVNEILTDHGKDILEERKIDTRARILIVEDEVIIANDLRAMLEHLGYRVTARLSRAEDAVAAVRRDPPDLVLMAIHLAGKMDGIQAAGMIHAETSVPVIFLTAHADSATLDRAKATAPYGYILKPFDKHNLHTGIQVALRRVQDEQAIREREHWLRAALKSIADGVIATDADDRIVFLNPVAERLIGRQWDQALGQRLDEVFPAFGDETYDVTNHGEGISAAKILHMTTPDRREILLDHTRSPIEDDAANQNGQIVSFRDVTEQIRTRWLLQERAEELMAQNEELSAFAHTVAHDIKDPLNIIYGYASVLADGEVILDEATTVESLRTIARYALRTCNIVDELLLLAQVRNADVVLGPLDMPRILNEAQQRLVGIREQTGARINHNAETWPQAMGYGPWVEEVWVNLLSNAMKYGGKPPVLKIGALQIGNDVRFSVRDNGQGITQENQQRLFIPFSHLHQVRTTGQGLGLSIVHRIICRLGGTVGVESRLGEGSTFYFTLPAWKPTHANSENAHEIPSSPNAPPHTPPARYLEAFIGTRIGITRQGLPIAR